MTTAACCMWQEAPGCSTTCSAVEALRPAPSKQPHQGRRSGFQLPEVARAAGWWSLHSLRPQAEILTGAAVSFHCSLSPTAKWDWLIATHRFPPVVQVWTVSPPAFAFPYCFLKTENARAAQNRFPAQGEAEH